MIWAAVIENIALYMLMGFLCWFWDSAWPIALVVFLNSFKVRKSGD